MIPSLFGFYSDIPFDWDLVKLPVSTMLIALLVEFLLIAALLMTEWSSSIIDKIYDSEKERRMEGKTTTGIM